MSLNKKLLIAILVVVAGGFIWKAFQSKPNETVLENQDEISEQEAMSDQNSNKQNQNLEESLEKTEVENNEAEIEKVDEALVQSQFLEALKGLGSCLDIKNAIDSDQRDAKLDNLIASVRNEIGDPAIRSEDWSNTHVTLPNGEQRRIRIEMEYDSDDRIVKRLKYYGVDKENFPVPIPLGKEVSVDPQESYIASLEKEGKVFLREKGERIYFQNGEELVFTEKNNRLADLEMNRNGRTYKCAGLESGKASCTCL